MKSLLIALSTLSILLTYGQIAPGGAGSESENRFWFKSSDIDQVNNSTVDNWTNKGGNSNDAYQNSNNSKPTFKNNSIDNINGHPTIEFDGVNDHLRINNTTDLNVGNGPWDERSFYVVFRTSNDIASRQVIYEEGGESRGFNIYISDNKLYFGAWNFPSQGPGSSWGFSETHEEIQANTTYLISMRYLGTTANTGTIECAINGEELDEVEDVGLIFNHSGAIAIGAQRSASYFENGGSSGNDHYFNGAIAEFIMYNHFVETAGHHLIVNYLSATYDIPLDNGDLFLMDDNSNGDFDFDLAGIFQIDANNVFNDGQGSGNIRINNASDLGDDEFLMWAHDGGNYEGGDLFDIPAGIQGRIQRNWRVQEQGEVGTIDLTFDLSAITSITASDLRLLIDTDNDGSFTDETVLSGGVVAGAIDLLNGVFLFQGVANLNNENRFSLGSINLLQTPLPIELLEFTGKQNNLSIDLNWSTISESNNSHFEIEKKDQDGNWKAAGKVNAIGNSTAIQTYSFTDNYPKPGDNIYRLVQYDLDGHGEYVKTINVPFQLEEYYMVYPNPPKDFIMVTVNPKFKSSILLINSSGDVISVPESIEDGYVKLDISFLTAGLYVIRIEQNEQVKSKKIVIP